MADTSEMVVPMLREMRAVLTRRSGGMRAIGVARKSFKQALSADSLLSQLVTAEFQPRIEALEEKVERLEARL